MYNLWIKIVFQAIARKTSKGSKVHIAHKGQSALVLGTPTLLMVIYILVHSLEVSKEERSVSGSSLPCLRDALDPHKPVDKLHF
jgi:hypothetical protein